MRMSEARSNTLPRLVLLCARCGVAYWGKGKCPSCGGVGELPAPAASQAERGGGGICADCRKRGACPPKADLFLWRDGDETCFEWEGIGNPFEWDGEAITIAFKK